LHSLPWRATEARSSWPRKKTSPADGTSDFSAPPAIDEVVYFDGANGESGGWAVLIHLKRYLGPLDPDWEHNSLPFIRDVATTYDLSEMKRLVFVDEVPEGLQTLAESMILRSEVLRDKPVFHY